MKALLLAFLVVSVLCVAASGATPAPVKASTKQYADSYQSGGQKQDSYYGDSAYDEAYDEDKKPDDKMCPDAKAADEVKQVHVAHGVFHWATKAKAYEKRVTKGARLQSTDGWSSEAVKAAFFRDRKPLHDHKATAAVNDAKTLFPSKIKELDGFHGTYDTDNLPSYEGLAVGPHPTDPDLVFMLHAINSKAEMFLTEKDGSPSDLMQRTKIDLQDLQGLAGNYSEYETGAVTAFYDPKAKRYGIVWSTSAMGLEDARTPPVFVAVSQNRNPLGNWTVWALDLRPQLAAGMTFCVPDSNATEYSFDFPQVSFSIDGIFIGGTNSCPCGLNDGTRHTVAALYAIAKDAIYCAPPADASAEIKAAVYLTHKSWYRSVTQHELSLTPDAFEPFNSPPNPARPQTIEDMKAAPIFVMKVDNAHLSVATLTDEPLSKMVSIDSAPKIMAVVVGKGADYASAEGYSDGLPRMPQPNATFLELSYLGMPTTHGGVVFWATLHKNQLYVATGEYWGYDYVRMPSVYWAIIRAVDNLCELARKDHGLVASQDGLALAYPVIAAREDGGALLAFSYSGKSTVAGGKYPAYPGVATAMVGHGAGKSDDKTVIHIIKKGEMSLDPFEPSEGSYGSSAIPWGIGSAAQVCGDQMWFSVPIPISKTSPQATKPDGNWYGSWITWQQL